VRIRLTVAAAAITAVVALAGTASAATFTQPVKLSGGPTGGEPSIAVDGNNVYVVAPQGVPSGVNGTPGTGLWKSTDDGSSFGSGTFIGSLLGGGDDDITMLGGTAYMADLEATATEICQSSDHGSTWTGIGPLPDPDKCTDLNGGQAGPSDDRPWLTPDNGGRLYLTYHEFNTAQPLIFRDDHGGNDLFFDGPCGSIVSDPAIEVNIPQDVTGGTLVARPVTDAQGNLYVLFATTTQAQNVAALAAGSTSGTFSQLYLAVSRDHCASFTDYTVFDGSQLGINTVQFGDIFNDLAVDGGGNLYVIGTGFVGTKPFDTTANVYMLRSSDQGKTWTQPLRIDAPNAAHMLPAAVGGPQGGELSIGYFRTANGVLDPNSTDGAWTYSTAQSSNANSAAPTFTYSDVNPTPAGPFIYHKGQICNAGLLCGLPGEPSDRSLLDFTSAVVDAHGCPIYTFAGNPPPSDNVTSENYVTRQLTGCFGAPAGFSGAQAGGVQNVAKAKSGVKSHCTAAKHKRHKRKKHSTHRRSRSRTRAHAAAAKCKAATKHKTKHKKSKHHAAKKRRR
jgi:hypothetical protein